MIQRLTPLLLPQDGRDSKAQQRSDKQKKIDLVPASKDIFSKMVKYQRTLGKDEAEKNMRLTDLSENERKKLIQAVKNPTQYDRMVKAKQQQQTKANSSRGGRGGGRGRGNGRGGNTRGGGTTSSRGGHNNTSSNYRGSWANNWNNPNRKRPRDDAHVDSGGKKQTTHTPNLPHGPVLSNYLDTMNRSA